MNNRHKVIFIGDTGVGKTSIIKRKTEGTFDYQMLPTVGSGHFLEEVNLGDQVVNLCMWDTAGQEQFQSLIPIYFRGTKVAVIVASMTDHTSIDHLKKWKGLCDDTNDHPIMIVAINKIDLQEGQPTSLDELRAELQNDFPLLFFISAKNGENIEELFFEIAKSVLKVEEDREAREVHAKQTDITEDLKEENKQKRGCC